MTLSLEARQVWAKSSPQRRQDTEGWLPLHVHLHDAAGIAGRLWDEWLTSNVRRQFLDGTGSEASARTLLRFLAGTHDIGKCSPAFAVQVDQLRNRMVDLGLDMPRMEVFPQAERSKMRHGLAGHVILRRWLTDRYGWTGAEADRLAVVVGGHHGIPLSQIELRDAQIPSALNRKLLGDTAWRGVQHELLDHMAGSTDAAPFLRSDAWRSLPPRLQSLATAIVVVSDWLASNENVFPLAPINEDGTPAHPAFNDEARVDAAWRAVGLPEPWNPPTTPADADTLLRTRFGLPQGAGARPIQEAALEAARRMDTRGLLILEAGMGSGKTEAALLAAEVLAERTGAGGLMVALPTQATSDAMFRRVMAWQEQITESEVIASSEAAPGLMDGADGHPVFLAHGKSWLNPDYARIPRTRAPNLDIGRDDHHQFAGAYVDSWLQGRKGMLADFVVGTIDQVLFAALQSRHVALRHLALARKVVVLDEIHACDAFMGAYLHRALEWLGAYGVPVIALSATLPPSLRDRLAASYQRGVESTAPRTTTEPGFLASGWDEPEPQTVSNTSSTPPLIASAVVSYRVDGTQISEAVPASSREITIAVERTEVDPETLLDLVEKATVSGSGCIVVIRNTVTRAQEAFATLSDQFGDEVELLHSRFVALDRKTKEARLVEQLGPPPPDGGRGNRPAGRRILVATQVVEQSLDLDFDLMITDLAPTDLLLQRMGRLHRHERPPDHRPDNLQDPRVVIVGVSDWDTAPPKFPVGSVLVYNTHLLYRAAAQIRGITENNGTIDLPRQIAPLVHEAYGEVRLGPESWQPAMKAAAVSSHGAMERAIARAAGFRLPAPEESRTLLGWLDRSQGDPEASTGRAQVRDSEDGVEVLLVHTDSADQWRLLDSLGLSREDAYLPRDRPPSWSQVRALAGCSVRLPTYLPRTSGDPSPLDAVIDELEQLIVDAWQDEPRLAGELILPLDENGRTKLAGYLFTYSTRTGLEVSRND